MNRVEEYSSGRSTSSTGSFTSYATLANVDYSEVISTCDNGKKLLGPDSVSMENNAASTATLACGVGRGSVGGLNQTMSFSGSSGGSASCKDEDDEDCDRDSSMGDDEKSNCSSDYSMEDCDVTIVDDCSFNKRSSVPKNEAELMFLQVVEILRFEKKVNHLRGYIPWSECDSI